MNCFFKIQVIIILTVQFALGIDIYANEGSTYTLLCPSKADSGKTMSWKGPPNLTIIVTNGIMINPSLPNKDRLNVTGDTSNGEYNLQIANIQKSDAGGYICYGVSGGGSKSHPMELIIREIPTSGPKILPTPLGSVLAGDTINVTCEVTGGQPLAAILWECNGAFNIQNTTTDNKAFTSIQLTLQKTDDGQVCRCRATHPLWTTSKTVEIILDVLYQPDSNLSIQQTPSGAISTGNKVTLTCTVSGGKPVATLLWNCFGNTTNSTSGNTASYSVELTVDKTYNGRICTCSATHPVTSYRPTVQHGLVVYYPPDTDPTISVTAPSDPIITGNKVTLTCTVLGGNPLATLYWNCTGTTTNNTSGNRASYSVEFTVDKTYNGRICTCLASHSITSYRPTVQHRLVVYYSPDANPDIQQNPSGVLITGDKVTLTCTVSGGNPLVTLSWNCTGNTTYNTSGDTASCSTEFTVDKTYNSRVCTCAATHPVTSYRPTVQHKLVVYFSPDTDPSIQQNPSGGIITGNNVTLTCTVSGGNPLVTLSWNCNGTTYYNTSGNTASYSVDLTVDKTYNGKTCTCTATHPVTSYRPSVQHELVVYYYPDAIPSVQQIPSGAIINGNNVTLTCTVSGGNPLAILSWNCTGHSSNNTYANTASYSVDLTVNKTYNGRTCTCSATHLVASYRQFVKHVLVVYYSPETDPSIQQTPSGAIITGNMITLTCAVSGGNPLAMLSWDCNGTTNNNISGNTASSSVDITVDKTYNGRICKCSATHPITSYRPSAQHELVVYYHPDANPSIQQIPSGAIINGNNVTLICSLSGGNPLVTLSWNCAGTTSNTTSGNTASYSVDLTVDKSYNDRICTCSATHPVTSYRPFVKHVLVVYYAPDVTVETQNLELVQGMNLTLTCNASGNPPTYKYHSWTHKIGSEIVRSFTPSEKLQLIGLSHRNIGNYTCRVDNNITDLQHNLIQSASTYVDIYFRPVFVDYDIIVSTKEDANLTTSVKLFSFPDIKKPVVWINDSDNSMIENKTDLFITFEQKTITTLFYGVNVTVDRFSYQSTLHFSRFQRSYEGVYSLQVNNTLWAANLALHIVISDKPHPPTYFRVTLLSSTKIILSWTAGFNGGNPQTFIIRYKKINSAEDLSLNRSETIDLKEYDMEITTLLPSTTYIFTIFAANIEGIAPPENNTLRVETLGIEGTIENSIVGPVVGGLGGFLAATFVVTIIIIYIRKLKAEEVKDHSRALTKPGKSDEEFDGLHDNILYESAGPRFQRIQVKPEDCGVDYATVNKDKNIRFQNKDRVQQTEFYSEVKKSSKAKMKGKQYANHLNIKNGKEQRNVSKTTSDDVYENVAGDFQNDGHCCKPVENRNMDGLQYADLVFNPSSNGAKFIIHGLEDRTIYAQVDTTQQIDPLPESDPEDADTEHTSKSFNEN